MKKKPVQEHETEHTQVGCCCGHEHHDHDHHDHDHDHDHDHHDHDHDDHDHGAEGNPKIVLTRIICAAILLLAGLIMRFPPHITLWFYIVVYLIAGYDILWRALRNIFRGDFLDENFLMTAASIGALAIGEYPEAAAVMLFYQTGEFFQDMAVGKSRRQIKALLNIKPEFANLRTAEGIITVSPETVTVGDLIIIKAGEKVPLDGEIIEGSTAVDMSALTGESLPQDLGVGNTVLSGSINLTGVIVVRVTKAYHESTVAKILYLVEKAGAKKAVTENFIRKFAKVYTPIVVGLAVVIAVIPSLIMFGSLNQEWVYKGLVFLVISCPCALVLSIPLSYFGGLGCASKHGILIKGGNYLEALSAAEIAVFDKTGTLTKGVFEVKDIIPQANFGTDEVLEYAAAGEYFSNHPIALSLKKAYQGNLDESEMFDYIETAGKGISMVYRKQKILVGNARFLLDNNILCNTLEGAAGTVLYLAIDGVHAGSFIIADTIKENARTYIEKLKSIGIKKTVMLTGDNESSALYVQQQIGVDTVSHSLLPQDKVEKVEQLILEKSSKGKLLFVGDGINDAPVLIRADIGLAMGGVGSDAAIESADVVIMNDELYKVGESIEIAKNTKIVVWQNIVFALGVKMLVMILSIITHLPMYIAIFADVGVALIAILNATRALTFKTSYDKHKKLA